MKEQKTIVCILGMHRSGTSMITRILNICGMYVGDPNDLIKANDGNKKGHWEHQEVLRINKSILKTFNGSAVQMPDFPNDWQDDKRLDELYSDAKFFAETMNKKSDFWGFKDPRTCLTLPFWQKVIPDMIYVIPVRGVLDVASSLKKRSGGSLEQGILLWILYWRRILRYTFQHKRIFTFQKNYFISWRDEISQIMSFLEIESFSSREDEIENFISPNLLHKKNQLDKSMSRCDCKDDFYPKEIIDLIFSDLEIYMENQMDVERKLPGESRKIEKMSWIFKI